MTADILYLGIFDNNTSPPAELCSKLDLSSFSIFNPFREFSLFGTLRSLIPLSYISRDMEELVRIGAISIANATIIKGQRDSYPLTEVSDLTELKDASLHAFRHERGICCVMVVRSEEKLESLQYRAHELLGTVCDDFLTQRPGLPLSDMVSLLDKYIMKKSPIEATNERLEEIKITLHQTIVSVLGRGEKIEDLQARTKKLSTISKTFYTQAKKRNSCCIVM